MPRPRSHTPSDRRPRQRPAVRTPSRLRGRLQSRLVEAARSLTTPLLPDDYLALVNPLWSADEPRGRVEAVRHEAPDAATLVIRPGRHHVRPHRPGQWIKLGVDIGGVRHWRTFSLSSPPRPDGRLTVTVKATPNGRVSRYLVHDIPVGALVRLSQAEGDFTLPDPVPSRLLFVTAGSGITPVMAMLRDLAARDAVPDVVLLHSARTPDEVIFGAELRALAGRFPGLRLHERHTAVDGRLVPDPGLKALCPDWAERDTWACGPSGMLDDLAAHWRTAGIAERLRVERFHVTFPPGGSARDGGGRVRFRVSGIEADADADTPLLHVGEEAGALLPSGCRMGICRSCVGLLRSGSVRDLRTGEVHDEEGHPVQTCVSAAVGPVDIDL